MKELKQYIEKELQSKKFLTEGLEAITKLEKFDNTKKEFESSIKKLTLEEAQARDNLAAVKRQTTDATIELKKAQDKAKTIVSEAEDVAKAIEKQSRDNGNAIIKSAEDEVTTINKKIKDLNILVGALNNSKSQLETEVNNITTERDKLLKKLSA